MNVRMISRDVLTETDVVDYMTEASTCGFKPGEWPKTIIVDDGRDGGNPIFDLKSVVEYKATYRCRDANVLLTVFND